jgi:hypothetical protein
LSEQVQRFHFREFNLDRGKPVTGREQAFVDRRQQVVCQTSRGKGSKNLGRVPPFACGALHGEIPPERPLALERLSHPAWRPFLPMSRTEPRSGYYFLQIHEFRKIVGGVISPLLANITLNSLDWTLHNAGFRFARYADDFVVLCQSAAEVKEAHDLVQSHLDGLGLTLSAEKTKMTQFREGFAFLGFVLKAQTVTMRPKAVEKFKNKIRELTIRHHNLDQKVIEKVNAVVRGTANYFATAFSHCRGLFRDLDKWLRMRFRCMRFKCKRVSDNWRFRRKHFRRLGVVFLCDAYIPPAVEPT